jgi:L-glyceraldehyde 3-phosphate reductase
MTQPASAYVASNDRYDQFAYRPVGRSGLKLPPLSLGLWHNFGYDTPIERQRDILRTSFDLGITHFDLANNYGTPYGSAETNFGRIFKEDFQAHRDELISFISPRTASSNGISRRDCSRRSRKSAPA